MPLHTVEEAAELMKVSPDTVREWVRSGRLRASKLAGSKTLRISTDDIMAFYDANVAGRTFGKRQNKRLLLLFRRYLAPDRQQTD